MVKVHDCLLYTTIGNIGSVHNLRSQHGKYINANNNL